MTHTEFIEAIKVIPGREGFWTSSAEDTYVSTGKVLVNKGFNHEEALAILSHLYNGAASCYGD